MSARVTIERVLRDDDDASGQTVRSWRLQMDGGHVQIARNEHSDWNMVRVDDLTLLIGDLEEIRRLHHEILGD